MLVLILLMFLSVPAMAQQPVVQAPTDMEILQAEARAAEFKLVYYEMLLRKQAVTAKETADYWTAYIGGRKPE